MPPNAEGTCEWLAEELAQARLVDRSRVEPIIKALRQRQQFADAHALADELVRQGVLSPYQAKRALTGSARALVIGVYDLVAPIDGDGMGTTYRAVGRADRRAYALKVLPQRNRWNVRLVRKQVQSFELLTPHPAVVPFVDVGTANALHYLVWPFVEGRTLEVIIREAGPMSAGEIARMGVQLAQGLQHCHERGIVHGLLKPTNVMIGPDGQARLLDYGIGALLAENNEELEGGMVDTSSIAKTMAGMLECASPELVLEPTVLTPAGDQYSLGCVLYYAATGRYPFPGGTAIDKVIAHQKQRPTPIRTINPGLPKQLTDVIERLMNKAPQDRYRRADESLLDLEPLARATPALSPPPPAPAPLKQPKRSPAMGAAPTSNPAKAAPGPNVPPTVPPAKRRSLLGRILCFWRW